MKSGKRAGRRAGPLQQDTSRYFTRRPPARPHVQCGAMFMSGACPVSSSATPIVPRPSGRAVDQLRSFSLQRGYTRYAEGSVLVCAGDTHVLCTASVLDKVPPFLKGRGEGWVTAAYGMLPRATHTRGDREAARGKQSGRTQEIQRLIGRSLRAGFDMPAPGEIGRAP